MANSAMRKMYPRSSRAVNAPKGIPRKEYIDEPEWLMEWRKCGQVAELGRRYYCAK